KQQPKVLEKDLRDGLRPRVLQPPFHELSRAVGGSVDTLRHRLTLHAVPTRVCCIDKVLEACFEGSEGEHDDGLPVQGSGSGSSTAPAPASDEGLEQLPRTSEVSIMEAFNLALKAWPQLGHAALRSKYRVIVLSHSAPTSSPTPYASFISWRKLARAPG